MTLQSEFAATLVDEWWRSGVRHAVLAPGSRSSPLAIALLSGARISTHVRLDERSACFYAIGLSLASGLPTLILTTSGTAAAELHAGVVEADLAGVPLVVCTADRPPELHGVGAAQTIEQRGLYGASVRFSTDLGVPDAGNRPYWRSLAARLVAEATSSPKGPGPVHVNLPFREPLLGPIDTLPDPAGSGASWHATTRARGSDAASAEVLLGALGRAERGVFVLGGGAVEHDSRGLVTLAERLGWPILVDARGMAREPFESLVVHSDALLRAPAATGSLLPDLVVHLGAPHAGRVMEAWLAALVERKVPQLLIDPFGRFEEPGRAPSEVIAADPVALIEDTLEALGTSGGERSWLELWRSLDDAADGAIASVLNGTKRLSEPGIARRVVETAPMSSTIFASSSMPIRDLEWFAPRRHGAPRLLANRGANGIDGVTSTLLGVAAAGRAEGGGPVLGLIGDLAFLHDLSGLVWGANEAVPPATLVVVDNAGGGIFNFLAYESQLPPSLFERGFGTPQSVEIAALTKAFGIPTSEVETIEELDRALHAGVAGGELSIVLAHTDRVANVQLHGELNAAVLKAIDALS